MSIVKNPNAPKSLNECIEESTGRLVDSIDRLTAAILASSNRHTLSAYHLDDFTAAYKFLQTTKGDSDE